MEEPITLQEQEHFTNENNCHSTCFAVNGKKQFKKAVEGGSETTVVQFLRRPLLSIIRLF